MSDAAAQRLRYVYRCLQLNPAKQATVILGQRAAALGLNAGVQELGVVAAKKRQELRRKLQHELDSIRGVFWTAPVVHLQELLKHLSVSDFPELQRSVSRMLHLTNIREQVNGLMGSRYTNSNLLNTIKRVMMLPPIEAGRVKDEYLITLPFQEGLSSAQAMVRMMKDVTPQVYQLEQAWFDQILACKAGRRYVAGTGHVSSIHPDTYFQGFGYTLFVIVFFLLFFARLIHVMTR